MSSTHVANDRRDITGHDPLDQWVYLPEVLPDEHTRVHTVYNVGWHHHAPEKGKSRFLQPFLFVPRPSSATGH
ncbi:hypothetical protein SAMN05216337_105032 [Bradyrhizobium brasilense]|uniref:Uncharacterized protein n=1 Tax=Bradyrhizobium brasilense TaxID=1419277 RepID=A0A1G7JW81_9BRAD|nr:hypothetical protein SAMN05216337_105032 [Bradyrhizobium brasilense]